MRILCFDSSEYAIVDCLGQATGKTLENLDKFSSDLCFENYIFSVKKVVAEQFVDGAIDISTLVAQSNFSDAGSGSHADMLANRLRVAQQSLASGLFVHASDVHQFVLEHQVFGGTQNYYVDVNRVSGPEIRYIGIEREARKTTMSPSFPYYDDEYSNPEYGDR